MYFGRQLARPAGGRSVFDAVVLFKPDFSPLRMSTVLHRGFDHVHLLEAARQRSVFLENAAVFW